MLRSILIFALLVSIFSFANARGAKDDSLQTFNSSDSIIVIGNRFATSLKNLSYSYETVPRQEIERLSSYSALQAVDYTFPSAFILENKVLGYGIGTVGAGLVNLRGLGGRPNTGVLVLVNGHPDFMGIFGHPLPDVYGSNNIQRLEILAGPASTVFGDHAMGGVINLVTEPDYSKRLQVQAQGGSYGMFSYGVTFAQKFNNNKFYLSLLRQKADGHIPKSGFESFNVQAGWSYRINPIWQLKAQARYVPFKFDDPSRDKDLTGIGAYADIRRGMAQISMHNKGQRLQGSFQLYSNMGHHKFYDGFISDDFSYGFSAYQFFQWTSDLSLAGGLDALYYGGKAHNNFAKLPNGKPIVNPDEHHLTSVGAYAVAFYSPFARLNIKTGLRYEYNSLPLSQVSPFFGISYTVARNWHFYANYQTGFRTPTVMELYLFPSANPNLKSEKTQSIETGVRYQPSAFTNIRASIFKSKASDLIQALPNQTPPPPVKFMNGPESAPWGAELSLQQRLLPQVRLQLAYDYLHADKLTAYNPQQQFKYALFVEKSHYYLTLYGKYVRKLYAGNNQQMPLPDYHLVNAQIGLHAGALEVFVKFLNLLNRTYYSRPGFPAPKFQARIGMQFFIR